MIGLSEKKDFVCRAFACDDEEKVKELVKNVFGDFLDGEFWNWKYKRNPGFDPGLVMVAERNGALVGCNHWLLKNFMLSPSLEINAVLGADIAVDPACRSLGVGKALLHSLRSSESVKAKKPSVIFIFADPSLAKRFHNPKGGYFPAPSRTSFYFKILHWRKLEANVHRLNEQIAAGKFKDRLSKFELNVLFKISNAPQLHFSLTETGITVGEIGQSHNRKPEVTITADLDTLQKVGSRKRRYLNIFKALLTGKLKINGSPRKLIALYKNIWILQEIFSQKTF